MSQGPFPPILKGLEALELAVFGPPGGGGFGAKLDELGHELAKLETDFQPTTTRVIELETRVKDLIRIVAKIREAVISAGTIQRTIPG